MKDHPRPGEVERAGVWSLTDETGAHSCDPDLPGDGTYVLQRAGILPERFP